MWTSPGRLRAGNSDTESEDESFPAIFIAGIPRGGTTWLSKWLNNQADVVVFGETAFWGRHFEPPENDGTYSPEQVRRIIRKLKFSSFHGLNADEGIVLDRRRFGLEAELWRRVSETKGTITPGYLFRCVVSAVASVEGKRTVIEKTPHHINHIGRILRHLPNSKFILVLRDPYAFMLSYKHQGDRKSQETRRQFDRLYHPALAALVWKRCCVSLQKAMERHTNRCIEVRTEELADDVDCVAQRILEFTGRNTEDSIAQFPPVNSSFPVGQRPSLTRADIFWMNLIAGPQITAANYELEQRHGGFLDILVSVLKLPVWAIRNLVTIRDRTSGSTLQYVTGYVPLSTERIAA